MKKRIVFDRIGDMKYISHLDCSRFLVRLFTKSNIKIQHSEGFTPRPKISFGNPVSLGSESYNELMDVEVTSAITNEELIDLLNENSPEGFNFKKAFDVPKKSMIANDYDTIIYRVEGDEENIGKLELLLQEESIIEVKEKRGKIKERDLKDKILKIKKGEGFIELSLNKISPKPLFLLAGIDLLDIKVTRMGYSNTLEEKIPN